VQSEDQDIIQCIKHTYQGCLVCYYLWEMRLVPRQIRKWNVMRFEDFTVLKIQVVVFWVVMPCSVVVGYQHFGECSASCWLLSSAPSYTPHLYICPFTRAIHFTLKMEAAESSRTLLIVLPCYVASQPRRPQLKMECQWCNEKYCSSLELYPKYS